LIEQTKDPSVKGYYARRSLERIARGHAIPEELQYPVQVWAFGNEMAMVNLAGEVVVDYAVRLKNKYGAEQVWMNAYANDVPCYIASRRVIQEGGYEAESSMYYYDKPSPFSEEVEELIVNAVDELMPTSFKSERASVNRLQLVKPDQKGTLTLHAAVAQAMGPEIEYMPEWKAFGWFTAEDQVNWEAEVNTPGKYDVYLEWSVSDEEAGKPYLLKVGNDQLNGKVGQSGSWFTYRTEKIGHIQLKKGRQEITFKPGAKFEGALLDLREIKLIPIR
jgi:hypothetical protein